MEKVLRLCCFAYLYGITGQRQMQYVCGWMSRAALYKEPGSRLPAAAPCLGRHAHPAGRSPNSSSLFLPLAAVVAVAVRIHPCSPFFKAGKTETPVPIGHRSSWWARVDYASRAAKNSPLGCFYAVFCDSAAAVRIHPCIPFFKADKTETPVPIGYRSSWWARVDVASRAMSLALLQNKNLSALAYVEAFWWSEAT